MGRISEFFFYGQEKSVRLFHVGDGGDRCDESGFSYDVFAAVRTGWGQITKQHRQAFQKNLFIARQKNFCFPGTFIESAHSLVSAMHRTVSILYFIWYLCGTQKAIFPCVFFCVPERDCGLLPAGQPRGNMIE